MTDWLKGTTTYGYDDAGRAPWRAVRLRPGGAADECRAQQGGDRAGGRGLHPGQRGEPHAGDGDGGAGRGDAGRDDGLRLRPGRQPHERHHERHGEICGLRQRQPAVLGQRRDERDVRERAGRGDHGLRLRRGEPAEDDDGGRRHHGDVHLRRRRLPGGESGRQRHEHLRLGPAGGGRARHGGRGRHGRVCVRPGGLAAADGRRGQPVRAGRRARQRPADHRRERGRGGVGDVRAVGRAEGGEREPGELRVYGRTAGCRDRLRLPPGAAL